MKRLVFFAAAQMVLGALWAQDVVNTSILAPPCGQFYVDGQLYTGSAAFLWPVNSRHVLSIGPSYYISEDQLCKGAGTPLDGSTSCDDAWAKACAPATPPCANAPVPPCAAAGSWVTSKGTNVGGPTIAISASPDIAWYRTDFQYTVLVKIMLGGNPSLLPMSCQDTTSTKGRIVVNGTCYDQDASLWLAVGTQMVLQGYPPKGYVFTGWMGGPLGGISSLDSTFVLRGPVSIRPMFEPAIPVYLRTTPPDMKLMADRTIVVEKDMPLDWGKNSTHMISAVSPQRDQTGGAWMWDSWSNGGEQTQIIKTDDRNYSIELTANFVPGVEVSFRTSPLGLKLMIDGRDNWPSYNFTWRTGSTHTIAAPQEQFDAQGRKYSFNSWSVGGPAEQQYQVVDSTSVGALASYDVLGRLTVESMPGDASILADGTACHTPCVIDRKAGTQVKVAAPESVALTDTRRLDFTSWSDGGPRERTWTAGTDAVKWMVNYQSSYRVQAVADPAGGATFAYDPASPDGFYVADTDVRVTVNPKPGFKFKFWEGDASGAYVSVMVKSTLPVFLRAVLDKVPFVAETGVRNAAADTPENAVAPGSIISIYGGSLAPGFEKGPDSPLVQTLSSVTVQVEDRILPLMFVSPEQINAQLPSDLSEGDHKVIVRGESQPDASAKFVAQRNAPGLFAQAIDSKQFALATHQDGTPVTAADPARPGETVTLLGTGLGPYKEGALDGFATPGGTQLNLADAVEIRAADKVITATSAMAAVGYVGITAIRFPITADLPAATNVEITVRVNGHDSNTVLLPVK